MHVFDWLMGRKPPTDDTGPDPMPYVLALIHAEPFILEAMELARSRKLSQREAVKRVLTRLKLEAETGRANP